MLHPILVFLMHCRRNIICTGLMISLFVLASVQVGFCQSPPNMEREIDSLTRLLSREKDEGKRLELILKRALVYPVDRYEQSLAEINEVLDASERNGDRRRIAKSYITLGNLHHKNRRFQEALSYDSIALAKAIKHGFIKEQALAYANIGREYYAANILSLGQENYEKALELELSLADGDSNGIAILCNQLGIINRILGEFNKSIDYLDKGIELAEGGKDQRLLVLLYMNKANTLVETSRFDDAIALHMKSIHLRERLRDSVGLAQSFNNLAILFRRNTEYDKAIAYLQKAREIDLKFNNKRGLGLNSSNIAINYIEKQQLDSVAFFFEDAISYFKEASDIRGQGLAQHNYGKFLLDQGRYEDAEKRMLQALEIRKGMGSVTEIGSTSANLGKLKMMQGDLDAAQSYLQEAESLLDTTQTTNYLLDIYVYQRDLHEQRGDFKRAYDYQKKVLEIERQKFIEDARVNALKADSKYELEKRDLQLTLEREKARESRLVSFFVFAVIILVLAALSFVLLLRWRQSKERHNAQLQLLAQRQRIETSKALRQAEEEERKRIASKLHDEVGALLSVAKLNIDQLEKDLFVADSGATIKLVTAQKLLGDVSDTVRGISHTLMPVAMEKYGLKAALLDLINAINSSGKLKIEEVIEGLEDTGSWSEDFQLGLYRIVQEILNNIIKHAQASHVLVQIINLDNAVTIYMEDNGKGFDDAEKREGLGLRLLKSNIEYLNGVIEINGQKNKGTFVLIEVPLEKTIIS